GLGPVTEAALDMPLGLAPSDIAAALAALQTEGFALRGRFTPGIDPGADNDEWCERRLLARIHRYTLKRLRAEIEPVAARDFLRSLFEWQRVTQQSRMEGPDALAAVLGQLEGFEAAAGAWETEILAARGAEYEPAWLDDHCLAGRTAWARLRPRNPRPDGERGISPVRTTPITFLARRNAPLWSALSPAPDPAQASPRARAVMKVIEEHGASFFDELAEGSGQLKPQVEEALGELVALGLVTSDSFAGMRALPDPRRPFCRRLCGRAIRAPRRNRHAARSSPQAGLGRMDLVVRRRPAEPRRRAHPRRQARRLDRQPGALSRRIAGRALHRRPGAISRNPRSRDRMAGEEGLAPRRCPARPDRVVLIHAISCASPCRRGRRQTRRAPAASRGPAAETAHH